MKEQHQGEAGGRRGGVRMPHGGRSTSSRGQTKEAPAGCRSLSAGRPSRGSAYEVTRAGKRPAQSASADPFEVQVGIPSQYRHAFGCLPLEMKAGLLATIHFLGLAINKCRLLDAIPGRGCGPTTLPMRPYEASMRLLRAALREVAAANGEQKSKA